MDEDDEDKINEINGKDIDEAEGYNMGGDKGDKLDETYRDTMDEAEGYDMDKDGGDKMDEDDGYKIDKADGDNMHEADGDSKDEADRDKTSKPNSTQNTIHRLEKLPLEILEKIFVMSLISSNFEFPTRNCWTFNNLIAAFPKFE